MSERIIFASYGNDSIALIQWAHERAMRDVIVAYSDTGWAADFWPARVERAESWVRSLGYEHARIHSEGMESLVRRKKAWPRGGGGKFQFCTEALKEAPALAWLDDIDPKGDAICMTGIRREESANRATAQEWVEESPGHGGRSLHCPLVMHTEAMRDALICRTPFEVLPYRSKECYPCVNARKIELRTLDSARVIRIRKLEAEMGTNSKGNERTMFSPARHGGAIGIDAVISDAGGDTPEMFAAELCDSGWCGR